MYLVPGKPYTVDQVRRWLTTARAKELQGDGYVLQRAGDTITIVPWQKADSFQPEVFREGGRGWQSQSVMDDLKASIAPMVKRTPMQRVDSLMLRFIEDCKKHGTVPGLNDAMISTIVGAAWTAGRAEITGEVVRQVAQHFLTDAERKKNLADYKKTVKPPHGS